MKPKLSRREFIYLISAAALASAAPTNILSLPESQFESGSNEGPNVLILLFDTLSARHMSLHGYQRQTTPNIDKFANRAFVYHNHFASGNFTSPSTASTLTGVYPWTHRALNLSGTVSEQFIEKNLFSFFAESHFTTAYTHNPFASIFLNQFRDHIDELFPMDTLGLGGNVYAEGLFPSDFPTAFWSEITLRGTDQPIPGSLLASIFEKLMQKIRPVRPDYREMYPEGIPFTYKGIYFVLEEAIDWILDQLITLPQSFLAYYHLWPPHLPYTPRADFINKFNDGKYWPEKPLHALTGDTSGLELHEQRQKYDEYIAFVDSEIGRLLDNMERAGILDNTMVILTSDHGELFERGMLGHLNSTLYQNLIHIPLLISIPNQQIRKDIYSKTSCIDLLPTILQFTGNKIPHGIEGQVLPGFNSNEEQIDRSIFAMESKLNSKMGSLKKLTLAMMKDQYKLIHYRGYGEEIGEELYDIKNDPEELNNLYSTKKFIAEDMMYELTRKIKSVNSQEQISHSNS